MDDGFSLRATKTNKDATEQPQRQKKSMGEQYAPASKSFGPLLRDCLVLLNLGVVTRDSRIVGRMLRRVSTLRHLFQPDLYLEAVRVLLLSTLQKRAELLLESLKDVKPPCHSGTTEAKDDAEMPDAAKMTCQDPPSTEERATDALVEDVVMTTEASSTTSFVGLAKELETSIGDVDLFLSTLGMMLHIDNRMTNRALPLATAVIEGLQSYPPPYKYDSLILGKALFYSYRVYELEGRNAQLKGFLMNIYRTSVLHRQSTPQAIALNLLLRNFLQQKLYDQALKFLEKAPYPDGLRSNAQHARYLYYLARINAVRLDYGEAYSKVIQAIRKAPQDGSLFGKGFRLAAHKLCVVIQLLMGEIPDRRLFNQKDLRAELVPYANIVQAVRSGGLAAFKRVMAEQENTFIRDGNIDLIQRLHHSVVRAGLRKISASYSAISLDDIASTLGLEPCDDTECIVSKAISDCVIDATIDVATKTVYGKSQKDKRVSDDPCKAFHGRIAFCLQLYNEALRAMQYPETETDGKVEEAEARRKEHQEQVARAEKDEFESGDDGDF